MANHFGIDSISELDGTVRCFGVGMNNQNAVPQFARATQVVPAAQKKNVKRLFPHGWCSRSHGVLTRRLTARSDASTRHGWIGFWFPPTQKMSDNEKSFQPEISGRALLMNRGSSSHCSMRDERNPGFSAPPKCLELGPLPRRVRFWIRRVRGINSSGKDRCPRKSTGKPRSAKETPEINAVKNAQGNNLLK